MIAAYLYCAVCVAVWLALSYFWIEQICKGYHQISRKIFFVGLLWPLVLVELTFKLAFKKGRQL